MEAWFPGLSLFYFCSNSIIQLIKNIKKSLQKESNKYCSFILNGFFCLLQKKKFSLKTRAEEKKH